MERRDGTSLKDLILERLAPLVGLPLSIARRAADMAVFHFGRVTRLARGSVGQYALHIQCPWRLGGPEGIITGRADYWQPPGNLDGKDFSCDEVNRQDEKLRQFLGGYDEKTRSAIDEMGKFVVESVAADESGGATLRLSGGFALVIFPDGSTGEEWRKFRPGSREDHFVVEH